MKKLLILSILYLLTVNFKSIVVYAHEHRKEDLLQIVKPFIPANTSLISPSNPSSTKSIQLYDFNNDGQQEILFTFEKKAKEQPAPSQFGAIMLKKEGANWQKVWETTTQGVSLNFSGTVDMTGDGTKEYVFGVTIGAAIGSELEIFQWDQNSLKKIAEIPYHKIDFVHENPKVGLAVWQLYIGDSYLVDVLKWDGEKLVYDEAYYSNYYPKIKKFYHDKIAQLDAWFYWYCLADAQIKANKFEEASKSIQKGIALAKKISMQDVIEDFNDLKERLENKQKHSPK